jgi:beta-galactosidase
MYIGADYYPEHWHRRRWKTDAKLMQEAGFNVVRLAEFAWVFMEPSEGHFEFQWLDDALGVLADHDISALLCTPTAAMPAWVPRKYPQVMAQKTDGTRLVWGNRKNNCFSSGTYRLLSERITQAMAEHFAETPNVIGWQTDNEFGHPFCYCDSCRVSFQDFLRDKYGTLDELNRAWGMHFWGHIIQDWAEITIPEASHNPSACLDWQRHFSWLNVRFQRDQVRVLRELCPGHFITHNFMGLFPEINYFDLAEDLDFVSWDNYPVWGAPEIPYGSAMAADLMRGLKRKNFWIMEQTAGPPGGSTFGRNPRPGEIRKIAYQQLAHGCDGQVWFRWRTCTAGREQYWHGLLGHDGKPLRRYREAAQTASEYRKIEKLLAGTTVKAKVAAIYDYDSLWAIRNSPGFAQNDTRAAIQRNYNALQRNGANVDMIPPGADFSQYKLIIAADLHVLPDALAERINAFVRAGGVLLTDCRTGVKDATNLCHERTLPGKLAPILGLEIEEYETLADGMEYPVEGTPDFPGTFTAVHYVDWITPKRARTLAAHNQPHLAAFPAVTRNRYGKGFGWYVGAVIREDAFYDQLAARLLADAGVRPILTPPPGVEVSLRESDSVRLLFLINHTEQPQTVPVPAGKKELLTGRKTRDSVDLEPYGVAVIQL